MSGTYRRVRNLAISIRVSPRCWRFLCNSVQWRFVLTPNGPVAQLGARLNGIQEVTGSIPVRSTNLRSRELMPKRELRLGEPREGCLAVAAKRRRRTSPAPLAKWVDLNSTFCHIPHTRT